MISSLNRRLSAGLAVGMMLALAHSSTPAVARACVNTQANGAAEPAGVSEDGKRVLFFSEATNLVPGAPSGRHLYLRDLTGCTTRLVDVTTSGGVPNGPVTDFAYLSASGRYVAFSSAAPNLVPGVANGVEQVYLRDLRTRTTELISVHTNGSPLGAWSAAAGVSSDGRYVLFQSDASPVQGITPRYRRNVWLRDRAVGTTTQMATIPPRYPTPRLPQALSPDGRYTGYDWVPERPPGESRWATSLKDNFIVGSTISIGVPTSGSGLPNQSTFVAGVSAGGQFVLFNSSATDLVTGDTNGVSDAFVRHVGAGRTVRISASGSTGEQASLGGVGTGISHDGRYVVFESDSADLVAGDSNDSRDVFVRDLISNYFVNPSTVRMSVAGDGSQANGDSGNGQVSADGRFVVFSSTATNLVPDDANGARDVFLRDLVAGTTTRVSVG